MSASFESHLKWGAAKRWTAIERWPAMFYYERTPGRYAAHVLLRASKYKKLTCDEQQQLATKIADKYSARPSATIKPYEGKYCTCRLVRCQRRIYVRLEESRRNSEKALDKCREAKISHSVLPQWRKDYPTCYVCNRVGVSHLGKHCGGQSCKTFSKMQKTALFKNGKFKTQKWDVGLIRFYKPEYVEMCYLTAGIDRFLQAPEIRPGNLNEFFKRFKGFENVTKPN